MAGAHVGLLALEPLSPALLACIAAFEMSWAPARIAESPGSLFSAGEDKRAPAPLTLLFDGTVPAKERASRLRPAALGAICGHPGARRKRLDRPDKRSAPAAHEALPFTVAPSSCAVSEPLLLGLAAPPERATVAHRGGIPKDLQDPKVARVRIIARPHHSTCPTSAATPRASAHAIPRA